MEADRDLSSHLPFPLAPMTPVITHSPVPGEGGEQGGGGEPGEGAAPELSAKGKGERGGVGGSEDR